MNIAGIQTQFEDGARNVPCSKYWCDICKVACISAVNLQEHIRGYQHRKVEQILRETWGNKVSNVTTPAMNTGPDTRTFDDYLLSWNADEPLIGLNYVIEYQRDGGRDPMYECTLCDFTGYLRIFVSHLGGIKHRMNYMSREYPEMVKWDATKLKQEELCLIVKERAAIIEKLEGRRSIKVIRGQDPPSTIGVLKRVPLPSNDSRMNQGGSLQEGMNSQSYAQHSYQEYGFKEWERSSSQMEQDLIEDTMYTRDQSLTSKMMYSVPRHDEGQYRAEVRPSDMYSDWRRDDKDFYEENIGVMDRYADHRKDNKSQYREIISSGYADVKRDSKEQYVEASIVYDEYFDHRGGPYGDRLYESADWRKVRHKEHENDIRSSDRYSNIRNDQPRYIDDGRGADWKRDDRKQYEEEYSAREQTGKSDHWMQKKGDYSQPPRFPDVIDNKRKKLYNYLQSFQIKSEDDASFVLKVTKAFKDALISYYQKKESDPVMRATLDQRTARSTGIPDGYSRYNPDASASAVRGSESPRGDYDWKQDILATDLRQSLESSSYLSSVAVRDSAMYSSSGRGYSSDDRSGSQHLNWGMNANSANTYFGH
ncbi:uncharacterized protein LOC125464367 isoform X1 [Stegostoma tigrinum]|uniref:uncharacterized protein LOC125464367 isoform X1 n=2 Tax=Stegostoma tigrinum TaxID=3053191 RepID=UPI00202B0DFD|nr:uncharacterized protein LOC125464367 isoform X1 [Stegostoma tigrinum]XP_048412656.1 uncharacterized protein LOC125464367 isoform X1 [Stegostoma tigrinum]